MARQSQAENYAMLVGTSEAALQYALGGISKLGGVSTEQLLTKVVGIDNAIWRVAAAAGIKIGSEVTEEELQLFLEPLYRTIVFGEDYSAPATEEILYTALLAVTTTGILEGGDIASYSSKNIEALVEQAKEQIQADGEKALQSGEMPDDAHLEIMELNPPKARGMMAIYQMGNMEDAAENHSTEHQNPVGVDQQSGNASTPGVYADKIKWGIHDIDVRPDGKGFWGKRLKQSDSRVDSYEMKINPQNESYYLPHPEGGYVQFENMVNSTVQDGKLVVQQKSFYHVNDMPEFAKRKVLEEALRQIAAARAAEYKSIRSNGWYLMRSR